MIAESVNPHAASALRSFWVDPMHRRPWFPEALVVLCRDAGFASAHAWCPDGTGEVERDRFEQPVYAVAARAAAA